MTQNNGPGSPLLPPPPAPPLFKKVAQVVGDTAKTGIIILFWFILVAGTLTVTALFLILFYKSFLIVIKAIGG
jgi:hypothetical protein